MGTIHLSPDAIPGGAGAAGVETANQALEGGSLGTYEESCASELLGRLLDPRVGCPRWPEKCWLLSSQGELVQGRCGSTNLCEYCAVQSAWENTTLLAHDALIGPAPGVLMILGTRTATVETKPFYAGIKEVARVLRREWPDAEYARLSEWTTGYGPRSGGQRRPHWNLLLKGVPTAAADQAGELAFASWCRLVDAEPAAQYVAPIRDVGGLMPYIAQHFAKDSQKPPAGFRGHRFRTSEGYLWTATSEARGIARESLQVKRDLWTAEEKLGLGVHDAELYARDRAARRAATSWRLWWA